jgi:hypothetical protein
VAALNNGLRAGWWGVNPADGLENTFQIIRRLLIKGTISKQSLDFGGSRASEG